MFKLTILRRKNTTLPREYNLDYTLLTLLILDTKLNIKILKPFLYRTPHDKTL